MNEKEREREKRKKERKKDQFGKERECEFYEKGGEVSYVWLEDDE